ncbi:MAG: deoxyribose-phosphate aldolase [Verrucomicrobiales bacterium]|jgi:deoxyribose-phosphate aldolase|nr:deoxyribose-phosphate aldolase [Verrucomicrobiales bacterium]
MNIAQLIDHTLLKPDARLEDIKKLCAEALEYDFYSVCINPYWITTAKSLLKGSKVKICTVCNFPLGASLPQTNAIAVAKAIASGAHEIDMVINIGAALDGHWNFIEHEIHEVVSIANGRTVKVILETCLLNDEQIRETCKAAVRAGASFLKTSTGFSTAGATLSAVKLMRATLPAHVGVKASGGIRTAADAHAMLDAGANRLGSSASVNIDKESRLNSQT